ncbi:hypothetical protein D0Y65_004374 [Glycine soja]|uniref:DUF659 domain-containing protein n=1 Tax=Glycine soja TaxID=3848 RepID=A0A445LQQ6_GLYSO|nr:hypothetical protein D0Y65_004374 [Glycine soja]
MASNGGSRWPPVWSWVVENKFKSASGHGPFKCFMVLALSCVLITVLGLFKSHEVREKEPGMSIWFYVILNEEYATKVMQMPLYTRIWASEINGLYSIKSANRIVKEKILDDRQLHLNEECTDAAHHRHVPRQTRTGHACAYDSGATQCPSPPPSPDAVEQEDTSEMSASSPSQAKEQDDDTKPLWTYVTKIKSVAGGGNYEIKCNICDFTFNGSYTRVRAHLLKMTGKEVRVCQKVTVAKLIDLKKIDNEATLRVERSKKKSVSLPPVSTQHQMDTNTLGVDPKKRKTSFVENAFNLPARETLDHEISRMFYSSGLPFHFARNPHYRKAFAYAANNQISGYQPPESGPMFLKAIDCSNEIKDKDFIAKHMREVIMEVAHSNVVQIVTDNAAVCKAAGLQEMVISDQWSSYKEDDVAKAKFVKDTLLDDKWWDKVDYILSFTSPIYDVLRRTDTEASSLHLVYEMWDSMIEKRNKMTPHRAEDLVFVHSNLRLLSRNTPQYYQEETKMWDVAGDDFGSLDDCGILEIASLSLDEPELEGVFFNDDC